MSYTAQNREGYKARFNDEPLTANPYNTYSFRTEWEAGWKRCDEGKARDAEFRHLAELEKQAIENAPDELRLRLEHILAWQLPRDTAEKASETIKELIEAIIAKKEAEE